MNTTSCFALPERGAIRGPSSSAVISRFVLATFDARLRRGCLLRGSARTSFGVHGLSTFCGRLRVRIGQRVETRPFGDAVVGPEQMRGGATVRPPGVGYHGHFLDRRARL